MRRRRPFVRATRRLFRKVVGLMVAVAGVAVLFRFMPGWIWSVALGLGLVWAGWSVFALRD